MRLRKGDLIQYNSSYWDRDFSAPEWVLGLVLGPACNRNMMRVLWFDDFEETEENNPLGAHKEYRMLSPGNSVG